VTVLDSKFILLASLLLEIDISSWHCLWLWGSRYRLWRHCVSWWWSAAYSQGRDLLLLILCCPKGFWQWSIHSALI